MSDQISPTTYRSIDNPIRRVVITPSDFVSAEELMDWLVRAGVLEVVPPLTDLEIVERGIRDLIGPTADVHDWSMSDD